MASEEDLTRILRAVRELDTAGTGTLPRDVVKRFIVKVTKGISNEDLDLLLERADLTNDQVVNYEFFFTWVFTEISKSLPEAISPIGDSPAPPTAPPSALAPAADLTRQDSNTSGFGSIESLWQVLDSDDVLLVRGSWLMDLAKRGGVLPRRQDCPAKAFISLQELQSMHEASTARSEYSSHKRAPIVSVSYFWRTREHPDPNRITLHLIADALDARMPKFMEYGIDEVGVFLDWVSLYQEPRSPDQKLAFNRSLNFINLWYAHALITTFLVTDTPKDLTNYFDRGWTSFEYALSWLIKLADAYNIWPQVVDLGAWNSRRPPPIEPDAFFPEHQYGNKTFTNGADRNIVALKFRETCISVFGSTLELDYSNLQWGDDEVKQLGEVFPLCLSIRDLYLGDNSFTFVPESIGELATLQSLNLSGCRLLRILPETLGNLKMLNTLDMSNCTIDAFPESIAGCTSLQQLLCVNCMSLNSIPKGIVKLQELKLLNIQGCALSGIDETTASLRGNGCTVLSDAFSNTLSPKGEQELVTFSEVDEGRVHWRKQLESDHGTALNPITGEELDIMEQCVNLQLDTGNEREVGDIDAYKEVISDFAEQLKQGTTAWAKVDSCTWEKGIVGRVNLEANRITTYDFHYYKQVEENGKKKDKLFVWKDCTRLQLKTKQILVKGDPAGGKTTFAKQLLIWIVRHDEAKWLVPVMIRTVDLVRSKEFFADDRDMVDQFLQMHYEADGRYHFFQKARGEGRLLLILDGFDEAGTLEKKMAKEISEILNHEVYVVLTSREMARTFEAPEFDRFRVVKVMQLNDAQKRQVIQKQLKDEEHVETFCKQLEVNPSLTQMAKNPLLLSVMLAVFKAVGWQDGSRLNRSKIYSVALDGMLAKVELVKGSHVEVDSRNHMQEQNVRNLRRGDVASDKALRTVFKRLAYLAHTSMGGGGIRDFRIDLIEHAIKSCGLGDDFTMTHWRELEEVIKKGRLPVITWFVDAGEDTFRFAHLTFQEFLCAEQCLEECLKDNGFIPHWKDLVCKDGARDLIARGWWQQCIQMFCDLVENTGAKTKSGQDMIVALANCFLDLGEEKSELRFLQGVEDGNLQTLTSLLQRNEFIQYCELGDRITSNGMSTIQNLRLCSLKSLVLSRNSIGPEGCKFIASFLVSSDAPLELLNLQGNIVCQGDLKKDAPQNNSRNSRGCYISYTEDVSGLDVLMQAVQEHPTLTELELRSNFLSIEAGRIVAQAVLGNMRLQTVSGCPLTEIREQTLEKLSFVNKQRFHDRGHASLFLSSGGLEFILELLIKYPSPGLVDLSFAHQALGSDVDGVEQLFKKLGMVVSACPKLETLNIAGFWNCGAEAGNALGRLTKDHQNLQKIFVGLDALNLQMLRDVTETEFSLKGRNIRDCGAGILSQWLPPHVKTLTLQGCGIGGSGFKALSQCATLHEIDGIDMREFTESCTRLDLSRAPAQTTGASTCILARTRLTPKLTYLDISGSNLTSKSHCHVMASVLGSGPGCNGGCDNRSISGTDIYRNCGRCDIDVCSTCSAAECPMTLLAKALEHLPDLETLKMADVCFQGGRFGPVRSENDVDGYKVLGKAFRDHPKLSMLDISKNHFKGPGFPFMAKEIAQMPFLSTVKLGDKEIDFKGWLGDDTIKVSDGDNVPLSAPELLVLSSAIHRNLQLRHLDFTPCNKILSGPMIANVAESLDRYSVSDNDGVEVGNAVEKGKRVLVDTVLLDDFELPFGKLQEGTLTTLEFSRDKCRSSSSFAPLLVLMLRVGRKLIEVNFSNLDFQKTSESVVAAAVDLAQSSLSKYNGIDLRPDPGLRELSIAGMPVMSHGIRVMAATTVMHGHIAKLNVSRCGMDAASLGSLLNAMLQRKTVTSLDVSNQSLGKDGVVELAKFLTVDTKLQVLLAQRIDFPASKSEQTLKFAKAIETNITLATLDIGGNRLHHEILDQLKRTMEEKRKMLPFPFESKVCFLLCNKRLPFHQRLPLVAQVAAHDGCQGPMLLIFRFCGQMRELILEAADGDAQQAGFDLEDAVEQLKRYLMERYDLEEEDPELDRFLSQRCATEESTKRTMRQFGLGEESWDEEADSDDN